MQLTRATSVNRNLHGGRFCSKQIPYPVSCYSRHSKGETDPFGFLGKFYCAFNQ